MPVLQKDQYLHRKSAYQNVFGENIQKYANVFS